MIPPPFLPPAAPPPRDKCPGMGRGLRAGSEVAPLDGPCTVSPARVWAAGRGGTKPWVSPWSGSARQTPTRRLQAKSRRGDGETATPLMSPRGRAQVRAQPGPARLRAPSCLGLKKRPEAPGPLGPLGTSRPAQGPPHPLPRCPGLSPLPMATALPCAAPDPGAGSLPGGWGGGHARDQLRGRGRTAPGSLSLSLAVWGACISIAYGLWVESWKDSHAHPTVCTGEVGPQPGQQPSFFPGQEDHAKNQGNGCHSRPPSQQQGGQVLEGAGASASRAPTGDLVLLGPVAWALGLGGCAGGGGGRGGRLQVAVVVEKGRVRLGRGLLGRRRGRGHRRLLLLPLGLLLPRLGRGAFPVRSRGASDLRTGLGRLGIGLGAAGRLPSGLHDAVWGCGQAGGWTTAAQDSSPLGITWAWRETQGRPILSSPHRLVPIETPLNSLDAPKAPAQNPPLPGPSPHLSLATPRETLPPHRPSQNCPFLVYKMVFPTLQPRP